MHLESVVQDRSLGQYAERLKRLGVSGRGELATALNLAGAAVRGATVAAEAAQTGLSAKVLARAQVAEPATAASLGYAIRARGGNVRLKYFGAAETESGVRAAPFGQAQVFAHSFIKGGRFPNRVTLRSMNGQVYRRKDGSARKVEVVRSGVTIPAEMVRGATAQAFQHGVEGVVARTIVTRLGTLVP